MRERWASFISGSGTTMAAIINACRSGEVALDVACIIASTPQAGGIDKAEKLGIPSQDIVIARPRDFKNIASGTIDQEAFGRHIVAILIEHGVTVITLNGWLHLIPEVVIDTFPNRMFNQHPGPVPEFGGPGMYGRIVHAARILYAQRVKRDYWTEGIAQRLHPEYDQGEVVKSERVPFPPDVTVQELQALVLPAEHRVQKGLLQDVVARKVQVVPKREPLVRPEEIEILQVVKKEAKRLYPQG